MISVLSTISECNKWISERIAKGNYSINRIPLSEIESWDYDSRKCTFRHKSGKFFSIKGIDYKNNLVAGENWQQPIIDQPEKGILGYAYSYIDDQRYYLIQAKLEPGNPGLIQVSPTLQATQSNLSRVHTGNAPKYMDLFINPNKNNINLILNVPLSETASKFISKKNYNIIVELKKINYSHIEEFALLPETVIKKMLFIDNSINMDARSILSLILGGYGLKGKAKKIINWLCKLRAKYPSTQNIIPLNKIENWEVSDSEIYCKCRNEFRVIGIRTEAPEREVPMWTQPILAHDGVGICGLVVTEINGVDHYLIQAKPEPGCCDHIELAPTVSLFDFDRRHEERENIPFANLFENRVSCEWVVRHSEEGGRFDHYQNDFCLLRINKIFNKLPLNYEWATFEEIKSANLETGIVNSELRTLIALIGASN